MFCNVLLALGRYFWPVSLGGIGRFVEAVAEVINCWENCRTVNAVGLEARIVQACQVVRREKTIGLQFITVGDLTAGMIYLTEEARFQRLLELPKGEDVGKGVNDAMKAIKAENPELKDVLPKNHGRFESQRLNSLLKTREEKPKRFAVTYLIWRVDTVEEQ